MRAREVRVEFTKPWSWEGVMKKFPSLYLNLAHFGQDMLKMKTPDSWARKIRELMHAYPHVYTDTAYHDQALLPRTSGPYFETMNGLLDKDRVFRGRTLFATDWSMTRHTWSEIRYVAPFLKNFDESQMQQIALENSLDFLFPQRQLPGRVVRFLKANGKSVSDLPKWLLAKLTVDQPPA
jgi:predicted TIM-barrel fold metal-dependent hydrolase